MPHYAAKYSSHNKDTQRSVVLSSPYGIRFFGRMWALSFHKKPMRGDIVLIAKKPRSNSMQNVSFHKNLRKKVRDIVSLMMFNIVKPSTKYTIMRVVATEHERVSFSGAKIYEGDASYVIVSDVRILPYVNTDSVVQVPHGEVFLTSDVPYGLDSRYQGTYRVSDIVGKVEFLVGPVWGSISSE